MKPERVYFDEQLQAFVTVYPEKKKKRIPWQRGEAYLGMKMRIQEETGNLMYKFTRKAGKY